MAGVRFSLVVCVILAVVSPTAADETLYGYEGNVLPYDESLEETGRWVIFDPCEAPCSEHLEDGHFVLRWSQRNDIANYHLRFVEVTATPPETLWIEWRFRSNHPLGPNFFSCDGRFAYGFRQLFDVLNMYGDTAISGGGDDAVFDLNIDEFHTYRLESTTGFFYTLAVDGRVFIDSFSSANSGGAFVQMGGFGSCEEFANTVNEWDFVRYGTIDSGEKIVAAGLVGGNRDKIKATFDSANYVYIDDIMIEVTGGVAPTVLATRRGEGDTSDRVEIVLDRPMPLGETTTFKFDTGLEVDCGEISGEIVNCVQFTISETGVSFCGDGNLDLDDEECDDGEANSDTAPDACRTDCTLPRCGDRVTDSGEQCDDGPDNWDTRPDACRTNCTLPTCGDNVTDSGEECDGSDDGACPGDCEFDCRCPPPPIPALSRWGLVALAALLFMFSKRYFGRRSLLASSPFQGED